ncbi:hypothetical protein NM688_g3635 [Phlebia brevispora]|uniref:Uncharacterized protein n=1 Tax=Phlebia brevispora TaxID=194682 RepID=A0ACC1T558_9APHY|nr:hypothetical protein NM688_g3635 [Phlebia brevispora]
MSAIPALPSSAIQALWDVNATRYLSAAGLSILLYDLFLTFSDQVRFIWKMSPCFTKCAFLANYYLVLLTQLAVAYEMCGLTGQAFTDDGYATCSCCVYRTDVTCSQLQRIPVHNSSAELGINCDSGHSHLDACNGSVGPSPLKLMGVGFIVSFMTQMTMVIWLLIILAPGIQWNSVAEMCVPTTRSRVIIAVWASPMLFEVFVLASTVMNALDRPRHAQVPLMKALYRDGITYFLTFINHGWRLLHLGDDDCRPESLISSSGEEGNGGPGKHHPPLRLLLVLIAICGYDWKGVRKYSDTIYYASNPAFFYSAEVLRFNRLISAYEMSTTMTLSSHDIQALWDANATRWLSASGLSILVYEYVLTFNDEVRLVWKAPPSLAKHALLFNHYFVLVVQFIIANEMCGFIGQVFTNTMPGVHVRHARSESGFDRSGRHSCFKACGGPMGWSSLKLVTAGFFVSFSIQIAMMIWAVITLAPSVEWSPVANMCIITATNDVMKAIWAPPMLFEVLVLSSTFLNALDRPRNAELPLTKALYRDGIAYFLIGTCLRALNLLLAIVARPSLSLVGVYFIWAMLTVVLNRLLLRLREKELEGRASAICLHLLARG